MKINYQEMTPAQKSEYHKDKSRRYRERVRADPARREARNQGANAWHHSRKRSDPGYMKLQRIRAHCYKYGVTMAELEGLDAVKVCPLCDQPFSYTVLQDKPRSPGPLCANIDHDHTTSKIRGVLCAGCNLSLGQIEKQVRAGRLRKILDYLQFSFP